MTQRKPASVGKAMDKGQAALAGDAYGVLCSAWLHPHRVCQHHGLTTSHHKGGSGTCVTACHSNHYADRDIFLATVKVPGQPGFSHQGSQSERAQKLSYLPLEQPQWL